MSEDFLNKNNKIAIVGVSASPEKWGNKVYSLLKQDGYEVVPVNPKHQEINGDKAYSTLAKVDPKPDLVITVVKPEVTKQVVLNCAELEIKKIWMQPGSESDEAIALAKENGIEVMHDACYLMQQGLM